MTLRRIKDVPNQSTSKKKQYVGVVFDSKLNLKENISSMLKKKDLENALLEKADIFWSQIQYVRKFLFIFYNAVICSLIMFGSVCWVGNISKFDKG